MILALTVALALGLLVYWATPPLLVFGLLFTGPMLTVPAPRPLVRPALALLAAYLVSSLFSALPARSLLYVLWLVLAGLWALVCVLIVRIAGRERFALALLAASGGYMLVNVLAWSAAGSPLAWKLEYETNNSFAMVNALLFPALTAGAFRRWPGWAWLAGAAFLVIFSQSRGGWLALAVGGLVWAWAHGYLTVDRVRHAWPAWSVLIATAAGVAVWQQFGTPQGERLPMWSVAWEMFASNPLIGHGPDTYQPLFTARYPFMEPYNHAHSLPFDVAAAAGLLGVAALAWLVWSTGRALWERRGTAWGRAALASGAALLAQSLVDTPTSSAPVTAALIAVVMMGLRDSCDPL